MKYLCLILLLLGGCKDERKIHGWRIYESADGGYIVQPIWNVRKSTMDNSIYFDRMIMK